MAIRAATLVAALWFGCTLALADTWLDEHNTPIVAWKADPDSLGRVLRHERARHPASGRTGERFVYAAPPGASLWLWRPTPRAVAIDELTIELVAVCKTPGAVLAVELLVPADPATGSVTHDDKVASDDEPAGLTRLVVRSAPARPDPHGVVRLTLDRLPERMKREAWSRRLADPSQKIDLRGAELRRVGLALPGVGAPAEAVVTRLEVRSIVEPLVASRDDQAGPRLAPAEGESRDAWSGGRVEPTRVTLRGDGFRIDNELFYPRVWRWRGEPFERLAERGINTVWLDRTPTPAELAEAAHHRLRVLAPPPASDAAFDREAAWSRVLAWTLPEGLRRRDLDAGLVTLDRARSFRPAMRRPVLAPSVAAHEAWARVADGLIRDAAEPLTADGRPAPATPVIAVVRLDASGELVAQLDALVGPGVASVWRPPGDVGRGVDAALRGGSVGLAYVAREPLDAADDATVAAALWLEAINRRLRLIEPWLVGRRATVRAQLTGGSAEHPLLDRGGVRLGLRPTLPAVDANDLLSRAVESAAGNSQPALRLTPAGLASLADADSAARTSDAPATVVGDRLETEDAQVIRSLRSYTAATGRRAAANAIEAADAHAALCRSLDPAAAERVRRRLRAARVAVAQRRVGPAYDAAWDAIAQIAAAQDTRRAIAAGLTDLAENCPLAVLPGTLTEHFRLRQLLAASARGPNRLAGGSFEELEALRRAGWRRPTEDTPRGDRWPDETDAGGAELVAASSVHGERVLRLAGTRIESPAIDVASGETLEVTGWARVEATAGGGLVVTDTLGGDELALRVGATDGAWRPWRLVRAAADAPSLTLTLSTTPGARADVDGVMVRPVEPAGVAKRPTRTATRPTPPAARPR